jgi:Kef-type K+ transport system membrane component KefB/nucleotide-binding universal stress UspA family protein
MKTHSEILVYLLVDLVIIIALARTLGWLARRVGQPAVIGEIVAGILLGPTVLGRLEPSWPERLFPPDVPLRAIADLGLVFFMFLVGLELDTHLIRREGRRAVEVSLSGVIAPLGLGMMLGYALVSVNNAGVFLPGTPHPPGTFTFALFLGVAMCITAFPVLARILVETGLYKTAVGTTILCAAAVDDVIAWILLAAVAGIANTGSAAAAGAAFVLTLIFVVLMVTIGRPLLTLLARRYDASGRLSVDQVAIVLAGVLLSAYATERIGIHAIFGAFIFGTIMPKRAGMTRELVDKVEDFTAVVLLPVFFAVTGLRTNLFSLNSISLIGWLLLILTIATVGKFAGCGLAARLTGASPRDSLVVGALMNTRGLTELVILSVGLSLGVLSDRTFAMMVIMALTTTVIAVPIVNRLIPREEVLRAVMATDGAIPSSATVRVLVALGNPLNAPVLADAGIRMTGGRRPAEVLLVRLIPTSRAPQFRTGLLDEERHVEASVESMRQLVQQAATAGVSARPISFLSDDVGADLARLADDQQCDVILLGWHRASLERHQVRSIVHSTFEHAPCDVVVLVDRLGRGVQPKEEGAVLVALSGGPHDEAAISRGTLLARDLGTNVKLLGYLRREPAHRDPGAASRALALQADTPRQTRGAWIVPAFAEGDALAATVEESSRATAVVVGLGEAWRGSEDFAGPASELAARASCPVLVVRAAPNAHARAQRVG